MKNKLIAFAMAALVALPTVAVADGHRGFDRGFGHSFYERGDHFRSYGGPDAFQFRFNFGSPYYPDARYDPYYGNNYGPQYYSYRDRCYYYREC